MASLIKGIHHITVCASSAQEDIDFMTKVAGQRLIKQTVPSLTGATRTTTCTTPTQRRGRVGVHHLPVQARAGRPGSGQIQSTAYSVPKGSLTFWVDHFKRHAVEHSGIQERLGNKFIRFRHPAGLLLEFVESATDTRAGWTTGEIARTSPIAASSAPCCRP